MLPAVGFELLWAYGLLRCDGSGASPAAAGFILLLAYGFFSPAAAGFTLLLAYGFFMFGSHLWRMPAQEAATNVEIRMQTSANYLPSLPEQAAPLQQIAPFDAIKTPCFRKNKNIAKAPPARKISVKNQSEFTQPTESSRIRQRCESICTAFQRRAPVFRSFRANNESLRTFRSSNKINRNN